MKDSFYQLVFLGDVSCEPAQVIKNRFFGLLAERGLDISIVDVLDGFRVLMGVDKGGYNPSKPTFAFYFGSSIHDKNEINAALKLLGNADPVYPIYFNEGAFLNEIPSELHVINASLYNVSNVDCIVNVAFEELRLLRKKRRVFISYKRSESSGVANQLYDSLSRHQFDVFLDTYAIRGAADFQKVLHHRITDSDVLIQLNTPSFMDSEWCREEISAANMHRIGVLQINWPSVTGGTANQLCYTRNLHYLDFRRSRYTKQTSTIKARVLEDIAVCVESIRARNLAARYDNLKGEFIKEADRFGRHIIAEPLILVERRRDGQVWLYVPAVGVPQSMDCYEAFKMLTNKNERIPEKLFLIYDDLSILPSWIKHLDWMNEYLEVKTIKKQEFAQWLQETK